MVETEISEMFDMQPSLHIILMKASNHIHYVIQLHDCELQHL